jgi:HTH-type transcriptional repressor of NAD biosynthesis genes
MSQHWETGVVIGKFLPPHRGHSFLISAALSQVGKLTIIVCERPSEIEFLTGELRASWLRELFPRAEVLVIEDLYDENDSALWARKTVGWLGVAPDVVFTSEYYGVLYTKYLGCEHVMVDLPRAAIPISATRLRENIFHNWEFLEAPVRAHFAKRVVVLGTESSGTTTLAEDLARFFNTPCVLEYGREYCQEKLARGEFDETNWQSEEFLHIAKEQARREDESARAANRVLVCDTDAFATRLWHERYCGFFYSPLEEFVASRRAPDLYLLTDIDVPFAQDGVRDGEHLRPAMHEKFIAELQKQQARWQLISGAHDERLKKAAKLVEELLR